VTESHTYWISQVTGHIGQHGLSSFSYPVEWTENHSGRDWFGVRVLIYHQEMGDTQASFSLSVRTRLRREYSNRCAICLLVLPDGGAQCAHLFDLSSRGANQVLITSRMTTLR